MCINEKLLKDAECYNLSIFVLNTSHRKTEILRQYDIYVNINCKLLKLIHLWISDILPTDNIWVAEDDREDY